MSTPADWFAAGNFLQGVAQIYIDVIGPAFYGVLVFLMVWPIYLRTQSILIPGVLLIFMASMIEVALPEGALVLIRGLIAVVVAASLFFMATRGRA